jgi:solute carrier family 25 protein 39/40
MNSRGHGSFGFCITDHFCSEMCQALKSLLHYHGMRGLFKGLGSTLLRDVPFSGTWISFLWCVLHHYSRKVWMTTAYVGKYFNQAVGQTLISLGQANETMN